MKLPETLTYDDVTLAPAYSELTSRSNANPEMHGYALPIIGSCMDTLGVKMMDYLTSNNVPFIAHRAFKSAEEQYNYFLGNITINDNDNKLKNLWFAIGSMQKYKEWIDYLIDHGVRQFCVDMAHGDSKACVDTIKYIKDKLKYDTLNSSGLLPGQKLHIIAGNVATKEGFKRLQAAGANGIRVGIASGQICSTNIETAMGLPILTSIIECNKVRKKGVWIIADGGVRSTGDIVKAVYFGADFCMIGKLLAATDLACGGCYNKDKKELNPNELFGCVFKHQIEDKLKEAEELEKVNNNVNFRDMVLDNIVCYRGYHGMASRAARANILGYASVEGVEGLITAGETTEQFIKDTKLRLQSSLSYAGARNWDEFRKRAKPYKRSNAGILAADVHLDVITKYH